MVSLGYRCLKIISVIVGNCTTLLSAKRINAETQFLLGILTSSTKGRLRACLEAPMLQVILVLQMSPDRIELEKLQHSSANENARSSVACTFLHRCIGQLCQVSAKSVLAKKAVRDLEVPFAFRSEEILCKRGKGKGGRTDCSLNASLTKHRQFPAVRSSLK